MKKLAKEARLGRTDAGFELQQRMMKTPEEALLRRVHNEYLDGRRTVAQIAQDLDLQEWIPDERLKSMKSRTKRTKFTAASLSDSAADPTKTDSHESPNLSGDESDRTASVAADYLVEHEDPKISTKISEVIQPSAKVIVHTATGPLSRRHHMSRRGRGGYGGGSGLKGATWEHDPSIQLESKPSDLFPVRPIHCHCKASNNHFSASSKPKETRTPYRKGTTTSPKLQEFTRTNSSRPSVYTTYKARPRFTNQDIQRRTIQCSIWE